MARQNLIRFRAELGFSAAVVAERAQLPLDTYRQLERGSRRLTNAHVIIDLSKALGRRMDDFYDSKPPPYDPERLALVSLRQLPGGGLDGDLWSELVAAVADVERRQRRRTRRKRTSSQ